jgi:starch synthase
MFNLETKSKKAPRILFVTAEVVPFTKAGGIADVTSSLAAALRERGCDVYIITPKHGTIENKKANLKTLYQNMRVSIDQNTTLSFDVLKGRGKGGVPVYFIDNKEYFSNRRAIYGYQDDAHRFYFFNAAVLEFLKRIKWKCDIIQCHDWHAGLIPFLLKTRYRKDFSTPMATIFTIHNLQYQGIVNEKFVKEEEKDDGTSSLPMFESSKLREINFMKRGIIYADIVNAVSEQYARDILIPRYGEGLDKLLRENRTKLFGILNGVDYEQFNPATDPNITTHYDISSVEQKFNNKIALQKDFGLPQNPDIPLLGMATRLVSHKGLDMLIKIIPSLMHLNFQIVVVGSGEERFQNYFWELAQTYPQKFAAHLVFDEVIASRIYAGSDIFLMPSEFEPCGLGQLIAMKYGSIPVAHAVGGLSDTVADFDPTKAQGTGFIFQEYEEDDFLIAIVRALEAFKYKGAWRDLMRRAMEKDFSWHNSAKKYMVLYQKALRKVASKKVDEKIETEWLKPAIPSQEEKFNLKKKLIEKNLGL